MYNVAMAEIAFTLSRFLRHSGEVLAAADESNVRLVRRDGADLVLTTAARSEAIREVLVTLARVVRQAVADPGSADHLVRLLPGAVPATAYLTPTERRRLLTEIAEGVEAAVDLAVTEPLTEVLDRFRRIGRCRARARPASAHATRPVAVPDDLDDQSIQKASGVVELPLHVRWSYPRRTYDLGDVGQRRLVYEQVLSEGLDDDVRRFIDADKLVADWDELVLPPRVRRAWSNWIRRRRIQAGTC